SICGSTARAMLVGEPARILALFEFRTQQFCPRPLPDELPRHERCSSQHAPPERPIRQQADREVDDALRQGWFTNDAFDEVRNSAPVCEEIPAEIDRIFQLAANFVIACAAISAGKCGNSVSRRHRLDDGLSPQLSGHHRVIDAFGGDSIDESARVANDEHPAPTRPPERTPNRYQKRCEVSSYPLPFDDPSRAQLVHETALQSVRRPVDRTPVVVQDIPDTDVHVIALWKDVRVALGRRLPGFSSVLPGTRLP